MTQAPSLEVTGQDLAFEAAAWDEAGDRTAPGRGASDRSVELARIAAHAAEDKLASDIVALDVSERLGLTDIFVLATGSNDRQVGAIVDAVEEKLLAAGEKPARREGLNDSRWVLLDYGDVVIHVQLAEARSHFALDRLWRDCPGVDLDLVARAA